MGSVSCPGQASSRQWPRLPGPVVPSHVQRGATRKPRRPPSAPSDLTSSCWVGVACVSWESGRRAQGPGPPVSPSLQRPRGGAEMSTEGHPLGGASHATFCSGAALTVSRQSLTRPPGSHQLQPPFLAKLLLGKRRGGGGGEGAPGANLLSPPDSREISFIHSFICSLVIWGRWLRPSARRGAEPAESSRTAPASFQRCSLGARWMQGVEGTPPPARESRRGWGAGVPPPRAGPCSAGPPRRL